jgi:Holliday junction resolvase RusA-like endonuclease
VSNGPQSLQGAPRPHDLSFDIDLNPIPLGRPQFVPRGRGHAAIMPARSLEWRETFRTLLALQLPREPVVGPLVVQMWFWRQCRSIMQRGDLSNLVKAVEDACNPDPKKGWRGLWNDDRQIEQLYTEIIESGPNVNGRVVLIVCPMREHGRLA